MAQGIKYSTGIKLRFTGMASNCGQIAEIDIKMLSDIKYIQKYCTYAVRKHY